MATPVDPENTNLLVGLDDLTHDYKELTSAFSAYEMAEQFYSGNVEEAYSSPKVSRLLAKFGLNDFPSFNLAHIAVDAVTDTLHINSVTTENNAQDNLLDDLRDSNDLDEQIPVLLHNAGKFGDAYLFVWPTVDAAGNTTGVRIEPQDPRVTRVFYAVENPTVMVRAIQAWTVGEKDTLTVRANLYYPDHIERWAHKGKVPNNAKQAKWVPFTADGAPSYISNPFGQVPYFHFRTDLTNTYGVPLHKDAYGPQLSIDKLVRSHLATVDFQSFPQRYALLDPTADDSGSDTGEYGADHPEDGFSPEDAGDSQLDASPNALWRFSGMKAVGQFQSADPDAFLKPLDRYIKAMAQATRIPFQAFDSTGDAISGESRRVANEPLYDKVENLQRRFGSSLRKAFTFAFEILGEDAQDITINWKPVRNINDLNGIQMLLLKRQLGVPDDVLLAEAGYNSADIDSWLAEAKPSDVTPTPVPQQAETEKEITTDERAS